MLQELIAENADWTLNRKFEVEPGLSASLEVRTAAKVSVRRVMDVMYHSQYLCLSVAASPQLVPPCLSFAGLY